MGRRAARALHLGLSALGAALYFLFIIPRWWVLTGDFPATLGTAGRIVAGVPIAAAAVPVMLALQRSLTSNPKPPELALRLRAWSAVLHVVAGMLIIVTAVVEIWLRLEVAGPWLFAVYGAAGAIAALAILAFVLSFTAEKPPAPAKPAKVKADKPKKEKRSRTRAKAIDETITAPDAEDAPAEAEDKPADREVIESAETSAPDAAEADEADATPDDTADDTEPESESAVLLNQRPTGKKRYRLRR
jgi:hypothetical protein